MRLIAWLVLGLVGCDGGGPHADDFGEPWPAKDATIEPCNPVGQTGCAMGDKCTWVIDQDGHDDVPEIAHFGCARDGEIVVGAACIAATSAANDGHDDCVGGSYCDSGVCETICDLHDTSTCDANHTCLPEPNLFERGGILVAGLCRPNCDPLTQAILDGTPACGSPMPAAPTAACVSGDFVTFACASTYADNYAGTDREPPYAPTGTVYINSCAPGYVPMLYESTGSTSVVCVGLCAPLDTDNTALLAGNAKGDPTALGKQPTDPAPIAGHAQCTPFSVGGKGSVPQEECRYLWTLLWDSEGNFIDTPYKDSLGYCFAYDHYLYDPTGGTTPTATKRACASLPPRSSATPLFDDDADDWGCYSTLHGPFVQPPPHRDRMPIGAAVLRRFAID